LTKNLEEEGPEKSDSERQLRGGVWPVLYLVYPLLRFPLINNAVVPSYLISATASSQQEPSSSCYLGTKVEREKAQRTRPVPINERLQGCDWKLCGGRTELQRWKQRHGLRTHTPHPPTFSIITAGGFLDEATDKQMVCPWPSSGFQSPVCRVTSGDPSAFLILTWTS
jgi:hypothetical protein